MGLFIDQRKVFSLACVLACLVAVIELVGMGSPLLVGDDVLQSSSIIITIKTVVYNTL